MKTIETSLNYTFKNKKLIETALTHSSYANEHKNKTIDYNERLEFLGDSVLSIMVSEYIFKEYRKLPEGELTKIRAAVVCETSLYECAKSINLGGSLRLGKGEEITKGRERPSILADAFEAVIAAIYLDSSFDNVKNIVLPLLKNPIENAVKGKLNKDYKTMLQEIVQQNKEEILSYNLIKSEGPDHNKEFYVEVLLNSNKIGEGVGRNKKEAEQMGAKQAMELMGDE